VSLRGLCATFAFFAVSSCPEKRKKLSPQRTPRSCEGREETR
jgi:hypothetical protein